MKMPFFASFIIFLIWLAYEIAKARRGSAALEESFWEKEARANQTRRKSLDNLNYITIPLDYLPTEILKDNEKVKEYSNLLLSLSESPIVNFSGLSNTDLKLEYGVANITLLMQYDQNYTILARTLQQWAELLYQENYRTEAQHLLEFAISTDTDVSGTYRLLAQIYCEENDSDKINALLARAENLKSGSKNIIVRALKEFDR